MGEMLVSSTEGEVPEKEVDVLRPKLSESPPLKKKCSPNSLKSLYDLCEEKLISMCHSCNHELINGYLFAKENRLDRLEKSCMGMIESRFGLLHEFYKADREFLRDALGEEKLQALESSLQETLDSKKTMAKYRVGSVIEDDTDPSTLKPDSDGNYPLEVLQAGHSWPSDVDPKQRELRLADAIFHNLFGMDKTAFQALPKFKQIRMKKEHNLF